MEPTLAYKPNTDEVLARLRSLYQRRAGDRIFASMETPAGAMADFRRQYVAGFCEYPDPAERTAFWDRLLAERATVEDDSIPSAYLSEMDQGLYGGLLGGNVQFMAHPENGWISSMVAPLLDDWSQFDALLFDRQHEWFVRYVAQLETFAKAAAGKFGISHFILIDGLNFVFELLGATRTYMSLDERPEMVRRATNFAFNLNAAIQETFFDAVPLLDGGTCSNMVQWVPGRVVSESVDPFHMTSTAYFETWGREPVQRIFDRFDGGVLHLHGNGRHLLETVCTLDGLKAIFLGDDRGFAPVMEILGELRTRSGDVPLVVQADFDVFTAKLDRHELPGGVFYQVRGVADVETANRLMKKIRSYTNPS
ncbi:MAG: hypothetical protein HQ567_20510 [Candidatus Nealsonbacteria bacterium]|nr:hypothetical protein [Candidatus Nealsonbacteria bacterium]